METGRKDWKYYLGLALFVYSFLPYCVGGALLFFKIPLGKLFSLLGIFIASAEIAFVLSAILLGKTVFEAIKARIKSFFKPRGAGPPAPIGKFRHYSGVAVMLLSALPYLAVEIALFLQYPRAGGGHGVLFLLLLAGDALFIASFFILGNAFWEGVKKLFEWPGH